MVGKLRMAIGLLGFHLKPRIFEDKSEALDITLEGFSLCAASEV